MQKDYKIGKTPMPPAGYSTKNIGRLIRGGGPYFDQLQHLIDHARESIHLQVYIYADDETGQTVTEALIRAAERGVHVFLLLDRYASSRSLSQATIARLQAAAVNFRWFEPLLHGRNFYVGRRMHHKIFVADGLYGLVGGINISNHYNDMQDEPAWLDCAIFVEGEISALLYQRCAQMWFRITQVNIPAFPPPPPVAQDCLMRMRINDWVRNKNQISRSYIEMFHGAKHSITIMSSYFLPGKVFRRNLRSAASRGIRVRIIITKTSDVTLAKWAERFFYPWLLKRNIEVYEYRRKVLHAKIATYDNHWVTIGSYNVNDLSAYASIELNLDIENEVFANHVEQYLDEIIARDCDLITAASLDRKENFISRMLYRLAFGTFRLGLYLFTFYFKQERLR
jgi:cardiolipin synthase